SLRSEWESQGVAFALINATDDLPAIREAVASQGIELPILLDSSQLVVAALDIGTAAEVLVLDPEGLSVFYRGPLHDHLSTVIANEVAGVAQETMVMEVTGCDLGIANTEMLASAVPDYAADVAPI